MSREESRKKREKENIKKQITKRRLAKICYREKEKRETANENEGGRYTKIQIRTIRYI